MENAKNELLTVLQEKNTIIPSKIECAMIIKLNGTKAVLRIGYSETDFNTFLSELDFEYDANYGRQELLGFVWFENKSIWLEREQYDGLEWWEWRTPPIIPDECK